MRLIRRRQPLPDISRQLNKPRDHVYEPIDDSDAKKWAAANPAKAAATKTLKLRLSAFWTSKGVVNEEATPQAEGFIAELARHHRRGR
jgi:hypothetical protein